MKHVGLCKLTIQCHIMIHIILKSLPQIEIDEIGHTVPTFESQGGDLYILSII